jgi:anion-transporting  ArsA/GET3 family ATPase
MSWDGLLDRPIVVVSGKGGTGKSAVAAALAAFAAAKGRRVLLAEIEGRGEISRSIGVADPGFNERKTPLGFSVLSIVPAEAAVEYLRLFSGLGRIPRSLATSSALEQLVSGGPGLRDLLAFGKLYEIVRLRTRNHPRTRGRPLYDLIVVDAPPTGQIDGFLNAPATFADLIRVGRMRRHASGIAEMLRSDVLVVLTAVPEEMAVAETLEALPRIREARTPVAAVVANRCLPAVYPRGTRKPAGRLRAADLAALWAGHGLDVGHEDAEALRRGAEEDEARRQAQRSLIRSLRSGGSMLELPDAAGLEGRPLVEALAAVMGGLGTAEEASPPSARPGGVDVRPALSAGLEDHLKGADVVVVCGSGGVGKTTVAASIGVHLAPDRGAAAVLTIDPARRLATALRLPVVPGDRVQVRVGSGRHLEVMQLDTQRTFDELIERHGGSRERKERILSNRFYRRISDSLAGTHEYMAMEKLYELAEEEDHDAIVIDTPPTRSALSFLDAPTRLTDFLGGRVLRWMVRPSATAGRLTLAAARVGAGAFLRTFGRLLGTEVLKDTVEFLAAFQGMYGGFSERADRVMELLRSPRCAFVVVTAPTSASLDEAAFFVERLDEGGMTPAAVVVNRWHPDRPPLPGHAPRVAAELAGGTSEERAAGAILRAAVRREPRLAAEANALARFADRHPEIPLIAVPELTGDVHDVAGLRRVAAYLFET